MEFVKTGGRLLWDRVPADSDHLTKHTVNGQAKIIAALSGLAAWTFSKYGSPHWPRFVLGIGQSLYGITSYQGALFITSAFNKHLEHAHNKRLKDQLPNLNKCAFLMASFGAILSLWKGPFSVSDVKNLAYLVLKYKKPLVGVILFGGLSYWGYQWKFPSLEALQARASKAATSYAQAVQNRQYMEQHIDVTDYLQQLKGAELALKKLQEAPKEWEPVQEWIQYKKQMLKTSTPSDPIEEAHHEPREAIVKNPEEILQKAATTLDEKLAEARGELLQAQRARSTAINGEDDEEAIKKVTRLVDRLEENVHQIKELSALLKEIIHCTDEGRLEELARRGQEKVKPPEKEVVEKAQKAIEAIKKEGVQKSAIREHHQAVVAEAKAKGQLELLQKAVKAKGDEIAKIEAKRLEEIRKKKEEEKKEATRQEKMRQEIANAEKMRQELAELEEDPFS